jgi:hypothetical protein
MVASAEHGHGSRACGSRDDQLLVCFLGV